MYKINVHFELFVAVEHYNKPKFSLFQIIPLPLEKKSENILMEKENFHHK